MNLTRILVAMVTLLLGAPTVIAADAAAGEQTYLARGCIGCHGPAGKSPNPDIYPSTAGKDAAYITEQINAFRNGSRSNPLMSPMVMGLTDDDVVNLAAYLSAQK